MEEVETFLKKLGLGEYVALCENYGYDHISDITKTPPARPIWVLFALFLLPFLPMHLYAPNATDLYPSALISTIFCQITKNMMSGEISPAIGPKLCASQPFFFMLALFSCPPVPLHYIAPIRAHPHPFTPICDPPQS